MEHLSTRLARELQETYHTADPFLLMEYLGINLLWRDDFVRLKGFYALCLGQRYIVLNQNLPEPELRVVAAHELGHDQLHRELAMAGPMRDVELWNSPSRTEQQANVFAAELLIPDETVKAAVWEELDYGTLCAEAGCPPGLMSFKLYSMVQRGFEQLNLPEAPYSRFLRD